nr:MAG TPA: hypothetical protein [Caudoviricetes sp.]DAV73796.1 MAG TPA: hypothetical protein [Caudoviricetes sp.]
MYSKYVIKFTSLEYLKSTLYYSLSISLKVYGSEVIKSI